VTISVDLSDITEEVPQNCVVVGRSVRTLSAPQLSFLVVVSGEEHGIRYEAKDLPGEGVTTDLARAPGGGPVNLSNRELPTVVSVGFV